MSDLSSVLKPNATRHDQAIEQAIRKGTPDLTSVATLMNPDTCPSELLGWLAWAFSVETWEASWPEATKRAVIKRSIELHRLKGTIGAVRRALETLGYAIDISEWFEYGGTPYTFRIAVDVLGSHSLGIEISPDLLAEIVEVIDNVKPVRAHFDVALNVCIDTPAYAGAFQHTAIRAEAVADIPPAPVLTAQSGYAAVAHTHLRVEVGG
ncbi:phage tail protein I [Roseobacter sp. HKCCD9010]|uniref:phage tail protein I n=1 Tax=unclassified Roseobacter TaxID=196798 RepID=UPI001493141B|nr:MULTISPECIES: phage tail protein I [unclassified Roseobacter]MBF9049883.1 phage tail protein I [Rhodobacterales bacterium HKCCD4356]NNV13578.1 phage tail protein I [Roseobacter sp. HKCCD7357]NNV16412.1 phage tail protein I [Roseobacter sp. HKCCD8768]NNV25871.1 phage tail protein I [Roseobacter sp. HKCCD8192]NNV30129.1 phage tail protein I [Roseobacter sp. HKCCD9061]